MSRCKDIILRLVEDPESIQDKEIQRHLDECPECRALFAVIDKGMNEDTAEDVQELTQQERTEILNGIRRQEQLLSEKAMPQKKMFFFKPKFAMVVAGIILIVVSWISLPHFFQDRKPEIRISQGDPESRKMKLVIQYESRPGFYLEIEYFPENKSHGGI